jgi:hypothetical protein
MRPSVQQGQNDKNSRIRFRLRIGSESMRLTASRRLGWRLEFLEDQWMPSRASTLCSEVMS